MTAHPYRAATLTPPEAPPRWQRVAARVAPDLLGASEWRWYRRARGGRWCRVRLASHSLKWLGSGWDTRDEGVMWVRVRHCPRDMGLMLTDPCPAPIMWTMEALHTVDAQGRCSCEVWP